MSTRNTLLDTRMTNFGCIDDEDNITGCFVVIQLSYLILHTPFAIRLSSQAILNVGHTFNLTSFVIHID